MVRCGGVMGRVQSGQGRTLWPGLQASHNGRCGPQGAPGPFSWPVGSVEIQIQMRSDQSGPGLHGRFQHTDWVENIANYPRYETQAAYFARDPSVPDAVTLPKFPCPISHKFPSIAEQLSGVMRAVLPGKGHGKGSFAAEL